MGGRAGGVWKRSYIPGLKADKGQEEPEYLVMAECEEVIKDYWSCVKIFQKLT